MYYDADKAARDAEVIRMEVEKIEAELREMEEPPANQEHRIDTMCQFGVLLFYALKMLMAQGFLKCICAVYFTIYKRSRALTLHLNLTAAFFFTN